MVFSSALPGADDVVGLGLLDEIRALFDGDLWWMDSRSELEEEELDEEELEEDDELDELELATLRLHDVLCFGRPRFTVDLSCHNAWLSSGDKISRCSMRLDI